MDTDREFDQLKGRLLGAAPDPENPA